MKEMDVLLSLSIKSLNAAAFVYLAACIAYFLAVARSGLESGARWHRIASGTVIVGFVFHTLGLLGRWKVGGFDRPPWTNLYESLVFFAWGLSLFQVYSYRRWRLPMVGLFATPLIFILMGMSVMTPNKSVEPLIPALQSYWLKIHVVFGMISYAGFTTAGCFAFLHLLRNNVSLSKIGAGLSAIILLNLFIAGGRPYFTSGQFQMAKTVYRQLPDGTEIAAPDQYREYEGGPVLTRVETVPYANIPYTGALLSFVVAIGLYLRDARRKARATSAFPGLDVSTAALRSFTLGLILLGLLFAAIGFGMRQSATLSLNSNPYLSVLLLMTFFVGCVFVVITKKYPAFVKMLPSAERLDELSYKNILFAFPFQTLLLITGAIWAYYAWGRSWGWDPKETWALITWFAFLLYLHGKLLLNWRPNFLSVVALCGFVILIFAFLGVNLVLSGLHSYGST